MGYSEKPKLYGFFKNVTVEIFVVDNNRSKLHSPKYYDKITIKEFLLLFGSESLVFPYAI
jgi:hypothetical protein